VPHLLLIGPRPEVLGKLFGLPVAVTVARRPGGRGREQDAALRAVDVDITDPGALLATAREIHAHRPIDAVLAMTELALQPASEVVEALGVRGNRPDAVAAAMNKATMRRRLRAAGLDTTGHRLCAGVEEAREFARDCPDGTILKPVNGNAGTGIYLVRDPAELDRAWEWSSTPHGPWSGPGPDGRIAVLAEEFLAGQEFSVETMSAHGEHRVLAVTAKHTTGPPYFVEIGHDVPAPLSPAHHAAITGTVRDALTAIGHRWGPCHTEVMLRDGDGDGDGGVRVAIVEINPRVGGGQIWELVDLATGVDVFTGSVRALAYGEMPPYAPAREGGAAIRFLTAAPGRIVDIRGADDALAVPGVVRVQLWDVGRLVGPLRDSWSRTGYVLAAGPDQKEAALAAELASSLITITTVPED
jgi:biotin carboxylase